MALEILWTNQAIEGFEAIVDYLESHFSEKEVNRFVTQVFDFLDTLKDYPEILESTEHQKNLYRGPINRFTLLTYRINKERKTIELINIRSTRQKPE